MRSARFLDSAPDEGALTQSDQQEEILPPVAFFIMNLSVYNITRRPEPPPPRSLWVHGAGELSLSILRLVWVVWV